MFCIVPTILDKEDILIPIASATVALVAIQGPSMFISSNKLSRQVVRSNPVFSSVFILRVNPLKVIFLA